MNKYQEMYSSGTSLSSMFEDIDARLTALEGEKRPKFNPENVIAKMYACTDAVEQAAMNYEKAARAEVPDEWHKSGSLAGASVKEREAFYKRDSMRLNARIADLEAQLAAMKTLKQRPEVIGACVIRDDVNIIPTWTLPHGPQYVRENYALKHARSYGGTAHRLLLGEEITP